MERIKNLEGVILRPDAILAEIFEIKSGNIILPGAEESKESLDYMQVVAVGSGIDGIEKGDYVLDMIPSDVGMYMVDERKYGLIYRNNIRIAVKKDNFNIDKKDTNNNSLSV
jgi:hypothetical protein